MEIRALILGCIFLCSLSLLAQEKKDLIVMKNGDRFTGEIKGLSGGTLFVSLDYVDGNIAVQCRRWPISRAVGCLWSKLKAEWYTPGR